MRQSITLTLPNDLTEDDWRKVAAVYSSLDGWMNSEEGPLWYGTEAEPRHIYASVEPSGLLVEGKLETRLWVGWVSVLCARLSLALGREVRDAEM